MTAQQQQLPPGQDEHTIKMNAWFEASFNACFEPIRVQLQKAFDKSIHSSNENTHIIENDFEEVNKSFDVVFDSIDKIVRRLSSGKKDAEGKIILRSFDDIPVHARTISELLEIVQVLATDNSFLSGRIAQIRREFEHQDRIEHKQARTIEKTITTTTEQERTDTVSQVVRVIDDILAH